MLLAHECELLELKPRPLLRQRSGNDAAANPVSESERYGVMLEDFKADLIFGLALVLFIVVMIWWDLKRQSKKGSQVGAPHHLSSDEAKPGTKAVKRRAITKLKIESASSASITVSWNVPHEEPSDYRVVWARQYESYPKHTDSYGNAYSRTTTHTIPQLDRRSHYKIRVRARYNSYFGPWSDVVWQETI